MVKKEKPAKEPKQPKAPKEKTPKQPKEKVSFANRFKKNKSPEEDGFDILTEIKEPFSIQGFFDTHVVERFKRFKNILQERGILFFLFSPFQARGRLIAQLFILCIGIMFGVVPRASSLVGALQDKAYATEITGLRPKTVGSLYITPAASSNYKRMHMIAFVVDGKNLPSDASKYEVHLGKGYGASDWEDVTYSWTTYPVTDTQRILLVAIDQSKQASGYGAFNLFIQLAGEELNEYEKEPFEITLSTAQPTGKLYDKTGIHLSAITSAVCGSGTIAKEQAKFDAALAEYQVAVEQAEAMPIDIKVEPTAKDLETLCMANRVYRSLKDDSTTEDILDIDPVDEAPEIISDVVITSDGIRYDKAYVEQLRADGNYSDEDVIRFNAFDNLDQAKNAVIGAMNGVNYAAMSWHATLNSYKLILNQTIQFEKFPLYARCTNSYEDNINFIDGGGDGSPDDGPDRLIGIMIGDDDDKKKPEPAVEEPAIEEPEPAVEEPATEKPEPAVEEPAEDPPAKEPTEETKPAIKPATVSSRPVSTGDPADNK